MFKKVFVVVCVILCGAFQRILHVTYMVYSSYPIDTGKLSNDACYVWAFAEICNVVAGDLSNYITRFQWDMAKYPIKQSLRNIADIISKQVGQIDADLKTKSSTYNNLKSSLQNMEKKQT